MGKRYMESAMELEIKARLSKTTPGEWWVEETTNHRHDPVLYVRQPTESGQFGICEILGDPDDDEQGKQVRGDAEFIAHAKKDIQSLINLVASLREELANA